MLKDLAQGVQKQAQLIGILILAVMLAVSLKLRQNDFNSTTGAPCLEATYHVLFTMQALSESPAASHGWLPTVSWGSRADKNISWGSSTVATPTGDYIYMSFAPPGFLVPYVCLNALSKKPTLQNLAYFNCALGFLAAFILFFLLVYILRFNGINQGLSVLSSLSAVSIAVFSTEALLSHGIIYWAHSLYQVIFVASLWVFFRLISREPQQKKTLLILMLGVLSFMGALTEWTGFIFNTGIVFILYLHKDRIPNACAIGAYVMAATVLAGAAIVLHYSLAVGTGPTLETLSKRFFSRSYGSVGLDSLIQGYALSYGLFLVILCGLPAARGLMPILKDPKCEEQRAGAFIVFIAACVPLLENILLMQHAGQFCFDRLKFIVPAAIVIALALVALKPFMRALIIILLIAACGDGLLTYKKTLREHRCWQAADASNQKLKHLIEQEVCLDSAVLYSNLQVRGYSNLLFHRCIHGYQKAQAGEDLMALKNEDCAVYLEGELVFTDLPKYTQAIITYRDGTSKTIKL